MRRRKCFAHPLFKLKVMVELRRKLLNIKSLIFRHQYALGISQWLTKRLAQDTPYFNGTGTSNRKPSLFSSWIEYWKGLTGTYSNELVCAACGCRIVTGMNENEIKAYNATHPEKTVRQACGGHVEAVKGSGEYMIAAICAECNQEGKPLTIKAGSLLVREVAPKFVGKSNR